MEQQLAVVHQKVKVRRNAIQHVPFSDLVDDEERRWYLERLFEDMLFRFGAEFFCSYDRGCQLLDAKLALMEEKPDVAAII